MSKKGGGLRASFVGSIKGWGFRVFVGDIEGLRLRLWA